jgi:ubiquitin fusion degradation protein 1
METLVLEPGDIVNIQSTELPLGTFVKFQPQDVSFLEISDPKAVLQRALNNIPTLTKGDIFTFEYNDTLYRIAVLEVKPESAKNAISIIDVDLNVDFAAPIGYEEPKKTSGTSTPRSTASGIPGKGGLIHTEGTMAQSINYASIAPQSAEAGAAKAAGSSNFTGAGNRVAPRKLKASDSKTTTKASTPDPEGSTRILRNTGNSPLPLRLPEGKLFLGYELKPVKKKDGETGPKESVHFQGQGNTLRKKKKGEE